MSDDKPCAHHMPSTPWLSYQAWHEDAEARTAKGEKQRWCKVCKRYFWPDEFGQPEAAA